MEATMPANSSFRPLLLGALLFSSAPSLAHALTWEEWNHSPSPFCGFIDIFCPPPKPTQVAATPQGTKPHDNSQNPWNNQNQNAQQQNSQSNQNSEPSAGAALRSR